MQQCVKRALKISVLKYRYIKNYKFLTKNSKDVQIMFLNELIIVLLILKTNYNIQCRKGVQ